MACDEAVIAAAVLIFIEFVSRWHQSRNKPDKYFKDTAFDDFRDHCYVVFFMISICSTVFYVRVLKNMSPPKSLEWYIPLLYLFDSVGAIGLGYSLFYENRNGVLVSMTVLTNFFLLHILHTLFAKKGGSLTAELIATVKSYIHHISSFLFLDSRYKELIVITSIWRAISMSGHSAQALHYNKIINKDQLHRFNWILSHTRNAVVGIIFLMCVVYPRIRTGFGLSAIGHVGYILVRAGPVFRLGSVYVGDRPLWQGRTDRNRLEVLLAGNHPYLAAEVGSLATLGVLFIVFKLFS